MYLEEVACTCLRWLLNKGGGLYVKVVACTWRWLPVFGGGGLYLPTVALMWRRWLVREGSGLYMEVVTCTWKRCPVIAHRGFTWRRGLYMKAGACMWKWVPVFGGGCLYLLTVAFMWRRQRCKNVRRCEQCLCKKSPISGQTFAKFYAVLSRK